jgi:[amino group carrier protein]-6-phospho-L-2-aminoadipate/5-phospho-L-glutamate reductase
MIKVSIVGASGYAGGELLRILVQHPQVEIQQVTSQRFVGQPVSIIHPNLRGYTDLNFSLLEDLEACDVLFLALPNGKSMGMMADFQKKAKKIIDLGADFRLHQAKEWQKWYKNPHQSPKLLKKFVYGLPELHRNEIRQANYVAGPGCEAAVSILSLWPLVKHQVIKPKIIVDAKMASSQAGNRGTQSSHHPERSGSVRSYQPTGHRHSAELNQELSLDKFHPQTMISATAIEMVRGILVTIHCFLKDDLQEKDIWKIYRQTYQNEPFIRIIKQQRGLYRYPEPKILQGTNYCDIGFEKDPHSNRLVVIGAIDNLVKGTAGNAVQCLNLMLGFKENLALNQLGLHPI